MTKDTIISVDFETYGSIPPLHSAASIGAVAFYEGKEIDSFYAVFKDLPHSKRDPKTMKWWENFPTAFAALQKNQEAPKDVMLRFYNWMIALPGTKTRKVIAANPASYDAGFLWFYCYYFLGEERCSEIIYRYRALDIRSYLAAVSQCDYSQANRTLIPENWTEGLVINHNALDDARQQGVVLMNLFEMMMPSEQLSLDTVA